MARVCMICDSFSVFILILVSSLVSYTTQVEFSTKDIYFYNSDTDDFLQDPELDPIKFELLSATHNVQKRESEELDSTAPPSILTSQKVANKTGKDTSEKTKLNKVLVSLPANYTKAIPTNFHRNLGENGTGIFRNFTTTTTTTVSTPPLLSIPIRLPVDTNAIAKDNITIDPDDYLDIDNLLPSFHKTVEEKSYFVNESDAHLYYNSTTITSPEVGRSMWVEFANSSLSTTHELLSMSHRKAATVKLSFEFPFYGHLIRNVTVATGGFIYTGDYVHSWLAATQYIAPLMANFDTSISNDSYVKYIDNSTAFTVQWENVSLQDKPTEGQFTFQATLHKNGDIVFAYRNVPSIIKSMEDIFHPVTIGLSDAYIRDHTEDYVRRKTIFEYHKVSLKWENIGNWTVIYLTALPTCLSFTDCQSCTISDIPTFKCSWCPLVGKCSVGVDRYRHEWIAKGCDRKQVRDPEVCQTLYNSDVNYNDMLVNDRASVTSTAYASRSVNVKQNVQMGTLIIALFLAALLIAMGMWINYAYKNPHTTSGQILIRYRPSQWRWRRGEARYTAATIHM